MENVTRNYYSANWSEDIWRLNLNTVIWVCLCCVVMIPLPLSVVQSYSFMGIGAHNRAVFFKKVVPLLSEVQHMDSCESKSSSNSKRYFVTKRRRRILKVFLLGFYFLLQNQFLIRFVIARRWARRVTSDFEKPRYYLLVNRNVRS
jgi:hypothetical protein